MEEKDPLIEANRRAMEYIWQKVIPKETKDGVEYVTYIKTDLPYLYYSGLVDTERFTLEQWLSAFEDCVGEDTRYWVSHEKMIWLGRFRYCKTVNEPFDPLKMREGSYSLDRLWKVFENSIIPSCSLPKEFLKNNFDQMFRQKKDIKKIYSKEIEERKKEGQEIKDEDVEISHFHFDHIGKEDFVNVERKHLLRLKDVLDTYPSPRRSLEMAVYGNRMAKLQELSEVAQNPQKSTFEAGKDFRETTKKSLKDMLVKASETSGGRKPKGEVLDVKSLQNRRPSKF